MAAENQLREILHLLQTPHLRTHGATGGGAASSGSGAGSAPSDRETPVSGAEGSSSTPTAGKDASTTQQATSTANVAACTYHAAADVLWVAGEAEEWHRRLTERLSENVPLPERRGTWQGHASTTLTSLQQPQDDAAPRGETGSGSVPSPGEVSLASFRHHSPAMSSASRTSPSAASPFDRLQQVAKGASVSGSATADQASFSHRPWGFRRNSAPQQREELDFGQALEGGQRPHEAPYSPLGQKREALLNMEQRRAFPNRIEPRTSAPGGRMGEMGSGGLSGFENDLLNSRTIGDFTEADLLAAVGGKLCGKGPGGRKTRRKRNSWTKEVGLRCGMRRPPRVMNPYSQFFYEERKRIAKSLSDADLDSISPEKNPKKKGFDSAAFDDNASKSKDDDSGKEYGSERKRDCVDASAEDEESGNKAKKLKSSDEKGKEGDDMGYLRDLRIARSNIGFEKMAQLITKRWRALSPEERKKYKAMTQRDQQRRRIAMKEYNRKKAEEAAAMKLEKVVKEEGDQEKKDKIDAIWE